MKTRIERRNVVIDSKQGKIGLMDIFDNAILEHMRVKQDELNLILEKATDEDCDYIVADADTFAKKRILIKVINKMYNYL